MRRCRACGLWVNADPQPQPEHYDLGYQETVYSRVTRRKGRSSAGIVRQIAALQPRGRFLDIGCSFGHIVQAAARQGYDAYGVDLAEEVARHACERGLKVLAGHLRHLPFDDCFFDVVHARHVLEHELEVYQSLAEIRRVLAPDGLLAITVPDGDCPKVRRRGGKYVRFWTPDHMLTFTRPTLTELLRRAGFVPVTIGAFAGLTSGRLGGALPFLGWRLSVLLPEMTGFSNTLATFWRKADPRSSCP